MLVNNLIYFIAGLVTSLFVIAQDDAWHLDDVYTLANEELDPVVSPNLQSSHMHKIIGGSRMAAYYNFDDYAAAKCSSLRIQADKSNYWMPSKPLRFSFMSLDADLCQTFMSSATVPIAPPCTRRSLLRADFIISFLEVPQMRLSSHSPRAFVCSPVIQTTKLPQMWPRSHVK